MALNTKSLTENLFLRGDDSTPRTITIGQQVTSSDIVVIDTITFSVSAAGALALGAGIIATSAAFSTAVTIGTTLGVTGATTLTGATTMNGGCTSPRQGTDNEAYGSGAGAALTSGTNNTLAGANAGAALTTESSNVHVGNDAGLLCTAANNVFVGDGAGNTTTTGAGCILIGAIQATGATTSDELRIGNDNSETPIISGTMGTNLVGVNTLSHNATLNVVSDAADSVECVELEQLDLSETFVNFKATSAAATTNPVSSFTTSGSVQGHIKIQINGVDRWLPFYDNPS